MNVLAVDPGRSGAVVLYGPHLLEVRRDFKTTADISAAISEFSPQAHVAVIELVHAMPGQGVSSMFGFGQAHGVALGALQACGFVIAPDPDTIGERPLIEVTPQRWQAYYMLNGLATGQILSSNKATLDAVATCERLLPHSAQFLKRVKDHNTADAILIALWYQLNPEAPTAVHAKKKKACRRQAVR